MQIRSFAAALAVALASSSVTARTPPGPPGQAPPATAASTDARDAVNAAARALGLIRGAQRIDMLTTIQFWGSGAMYEAPAGARRDAPWLPSKVIAYKGSIGFDGDGRFEIGMRTEIEREDAAPPARTGAGAVAGSRKQVQVVSGVFAWDEDRPGGGVAGYGSATPAMAALPERLLQVWMSPHGAIKAARLAGDKVRLSSAAGKRVLTFPLPEPLQSMLLKVTLDDRNLPEQVETTVRSAVLGSAVLTASYAGYADLGAPLNLRTDILFPARIVQTLGGHPTLDLTIAQVNAYNPYVVFPVPDSVKSVSTQVSVKPETLPRRK